MAERRDLSVGESNKLEGLSNYHVWRLKIRAIFQSENSWEVVESAISPTIFLAVLPSRRHGTEQQPCYLKTIACRAITMSAKDSQVDTVAEHEDLASAWEKLRALYQNGDPFIVLFVTNQLNQMKMPEGGVMEEYLNKARELKNCLAAWEELVFDHRLVQVVLNSLPRSYEYIIPTTTNSAMFLTFDRINVVLLTEHHKLQHRNLHLGDKEALRQIKLDNVIYIPSLKRNLMSVDTLIDRGNMVVFMKNKCFVLNNSSNRLIIRSGSRGNGFYIPH
uniref:DUF4219 domain-containing protein n=1 Tax=Physcomitrium patens TaxID=3218 RepID=A0A2K1KKL7_PHYPA|nr:hypothetical protein PHYPA_007994 [Physcomitrium patens]